MIRSCISKKALASTAAQQRLPSVRRLDPVLATAVPGNRKNDMNRGSSKNPAFSTLQAVTADDNKFVVAHSSSSSPKYNVHRPFHAVRFSSRAAAAYCSPDDAGQYGGCCLDEHDYGYRFVSPLATSSRYTCTENRGESSSSFSSSSSPDEYSRIMGTSSVAVAVANDAGLVSSDLWDASCALDDQGNVVFFEEAEGCILDDNYVVVD